MGFFFILLYVVPLIVALWVFFDSQKHGYTFTQGLLWAIGVFFLLIVFLPLYFFYRTKRKQLVKVPGAPPFPPAPLPAFIAVSPTRGIQNLPHCGQKLKLQD